MLFFPGSWVLHQRLYLVEADDDVYSVSYLILGAHCCCLPVNHADTEDGVKGQKPLPFYRWGLGSPYTSIVILH